MHALPPGGEGGLVPDVLTPGMNLWSILERARRLYPAELAVVEPGFARHALTLAPRFVKPPASARKPPCQAPGRSRSRVHSGSVFSRSSFA